MWYSDNNFTTHKSGLGFTFSLKKLKNNTQCQHPSKEFKSSCIGLHIPAVYQTTCNCKIVLLINFADYRIGHHSISPAEGTAWGHCVDGTGFSGRFKDHEAHSCFTMLNNTLSKIYFVKYTTGFYIDLLILSKPTNKT